MSFRKERFFYPPIFKKSENFRSELSHNYEALATQEKINWNLEFLSNFPVFKIFIDGPANAGKGTLAARFHEEDLNIKKVNTGNIYRSITFHLIELGYKDEKLIEELPEEELGKILENIEIHLGENGLDWWIENKKNNFRVNISSSLRLPEVEKNISHVAKRHAVREKVRERQEAMVRDNGRVLVEGRDMWFLFPGFTNGFLVYLSVSKEESIKRETQDQKSQGKTMTEQEIEELTLIRDQKDRNRQGEGQLLTYEEAVDSGKYDLVIDTTDKLIDQVYLLVLEGLTEKLFVNAESSA